MMTNSEHIIRKSSSWWKRRSTLEKALTVMSVFCILLSISLIIGIKYIATTIRNCDRTLANLTSTDNRQGKASKIVEPDTICLSPECIHTASKILRNMDSEINPCDNFYEFACGNFVKNAGVMDDQETVDSFSMVSDNLQKQLRSSIENIEDNEKRAFRLTKILYQSCMNTTLIEEQGLKSLFRVLDKLGGWPVLLDDWSDQDFNWTEATYKNGKIGLSLDYFLSFYISVNPKNSSQRMITLDRPSLEIPLDHLLSDSFDALKSYYDYMVDIAMILGGNKDRATKELRESLLFEDSLAKISFRNMRRNASELYNPMTIEELSRTYPSIPWLNYLNRIIEPYVRLQPSEVINVREPKFISDLEKLLRVTPKRVQANYALWRVVYDSVNYLNQEIREQKFVYWNEADGRTESELRWQECIDVVLEEMSLSVSALYIRDHFDEEAKKNVIEMVSDIRREFRKIIEKVDWMDEETRQVALDKLDAVGSFVAYPDELRDDAKLESFYAPLEITPGDYLQSILNITLFNSAYAFSQLRLPVKLNDWITYGELVEVNAYYSPSDNSMQLPVGILQGEFFSKNRPRYVNYGALGSIMGHEITHGFDDQGSQYDKHGNLVEWWKQETKEKFLNKIQCIIYQYGNYSDEERGITVNGVDTQSENIADNGGTKEAYLAYDEWLRQNGPEPLLPGLNYTAKQMFWISVANTWCSTENAGNLFAEEHSPSEFRVIGPLSNMHQFAKDFKCPLGSKMNPEKKCVIW